LGWPVWAEENNGFSLLSIDLIDFQLGYELPKFMQNSNETGI
jgi:hypothetical protein